MRNECLSRPLDAAVPSIQPAPLLKLYPWDREYENQLSNAADSTGELYPTYERTTTAHRTLRPWNDDQPSR